MGTNTFFCPICNRNTHHLEVSLVETAALQGGNSVVRVAAAAADYFGASKIIKAGTGFGIWKCSECTSVFTRDAAGSIQKTLQIGTPNNSIQTSQERAEFVLNMDAVNKYFVVQNVMFINGEDPFLSREPVWVHKGEGYYGKEVDLYKIHFYSKDLEMEKRREFIRELVNFFGESHRSEIEWAWRKKGSEYCICNLTKDKTIEVWNNFKETAIADYMVIE